MIHKFKCKFTAEDGAYSMTMYDLLTENEDEIKELIENQGYKVKEIYSIRVQ